MAKKKTDVALIKPNCIYCKNGADLGNHMSGCLFHPFPRSNGVRGKVQCDKDEFEVDEDKYKEWVNR